MGPRGVILGGTAAILLLTACGGSSHKTASTTSSVVTTAPAITSAPEPAITHRLLTSSEMPPGFSAQGQPSVASSAAQWAQQGGTANGVQSETARLKRLGFIAGATLNLNSGQGAGLSLVEQFRSDTGARGELANTNKTFGVQSPVRFSVRGIPGSTGFGGVGTGQGVNVAFADGDFYYLVGEQPNGPANRAAVISSAQKLYRRVHG